MDYGVSQPRVDQILLRFPGRSGRTPPIRRRLSAILQVAQGPDGFQAVVGVHSGKHNFFTFHRLLLLNKG